MSSVDLIESPKQVLCGLVDIVASGVIWKIVPQWRSRKLDFEYVYFVQEQDYARSHEPSRVDNRVEK